MNNSDNSLDREPTSSAAYTQAESDLILSPNIPDGDGFYDELLLAHEGLTKDDSDAFNARLILLLCNHIGDRHIIRQALKAAAPARPAAISKS